MFSQRHWGLGPQSTRYFRHKNSRDQRPKIFRIFLSVRLRPEPSVYYFRIIAVLLFSFHLYLGVKIENS